MNVKEKKVPVQLKNTEAIFQRFVSWGPRPALYWRGTILTYADFFTRVNNWVMELETQGVKAGSVCVIYGDYSPASCTLLFALMKMRAISVPLTSAVDSELDRLIKIAGVEFFLRFDEFDQLRIEMCFSHGANACHGENPIVFNRSQPL